MCFYRPPANCQVPNLGGKWEALFGRRRTGYFVEVGAYDGENFSNTSCLADVGWSGLYIEPIAEFAEKCRMRHANNAGVSVLVTAVAEKAGATEIFVGDTLSTIVGEQVADYEKIDWAKGLHQGQKRQVATETLDALLERGAVPTDFDLLVVDVEGAEGRVFAAFDLEKWKPKALLVELEDEHPDFRHNGRVIREAKSIRRRIEGAGYQAYFRDQINTLYVRPDVLESATAKADGGAAEDVVGETPTEETSLEAALAESSRTPRVTIGIPVYNGALTLAKALDGVSRQTYRDFVVLIADNASTDDTANMVDTFAEHEPNVSVIHRPSGVPVWENFTDLLRRADTEYFVWLADDDWWEPDYLAECVAALDRNPYAVSAFSHFRVYYHYLTRFSRVATHVPSLSHDSSLNFIIRSSDMAPCAVYSVHKRSILLEAASSIDLSTDFSDVLVTLVLALRGQMEIVPRDLYRCGVRNERLVHRRPLTADKIQFRPFIKTANRAIFRTFPRFRALLVALNFNWRNYENYRHLKRHNASGAALDVSRLLTGEQVAAETPKTAGRELQPARENGRVERHMNSDRRR
jgi:FkbM family methyltransferase